MLGGIWSSEGCYGEVTTEAGGGGLGEGGGAEAHSRGSLSWPGARARMLTFLHCTLHAARASMSHIAHCVPPEVASSGSHRKQSGLANDE